MQLNLKPAKSSFQKIDFRKHFDYLLQDDRLLFATLTFVGVLAIIVLYIAFVVIYK